MPHLHVLRVFVGEDAEGRPVGGNPLGVFLDGAEVPAGERQATARDLGFSETVFVDDAERGEVRIFTPAVELPFAGHPLVGTAWLLREVGREPQMLRPPPGEVPVRFADGMTYVSGRPEWSPRFAHVQLGSPGEVEALDGPPEGYGAVGVWAWEDEAAGRMRVRVFVPELGVAEDEATGSHAVRLAAHLGRELVIRQGVGSVIYAEPGADGMVEIGGKVVPDDEREYGGKP
ncbi:putative epimerase PhzC/PhzF like protein [Rubrobacter radiotolerans]|uniref:PhzF family phenazine biosynthesis protein n=1 Tax=Rubrobacter radiotolerans TaxID=42256 RepID=A0A023X553_RUBRA|nr:PhzF family phenazine biosynthesis protein [Rubrobacter radiotolerans]AHY47115.1 putative epimerase PhzC/PhzF like protein [Rubrobacter radiotolerans]MDX5894520.1 PhzF family phenazine biosynthesis protein [Rubrobacter radiotolerans]SMC06178.1 phenazine biosynthesis protein PhzF family [Rubrobacter radiotolerans DSM 5868]